MQATLWAVLLAGVGLAALVDRHINSSGAAQLGPELVNGPLHFRLPANWKLGRRLDPSMVIRAVDMVGQQGPLPRRALSIYRQRLARQMGPDEYLLRRGLLDEIFGTPQPDVRTESATVAGQPALVLQGEGEITTD